MDLDKLIRKNIQELKPYSSARDEYTGEALVYLDANENPFNSPYNRYPDPLQRKLKKKIASLKNVSEDIIFLGNGSDEPIDLLIRAFCEPGIDNIITTDPTYGMYEVSANVNNIEVRKVSLNDDFQLNPEEFISLSDKNTKLTFLCSPNNPTGNSLHRDSILKIIREFQGLVILDEAYIDFVVEKSFLPELEKHNNLVILQTFSKAWGMAGIRLGMAFASPEIIRILNKIKYPYNINILVQEKALELLEQEGDKQKWVEKILDEKKQLAEKISNFPFTVKVYPSDANFILVKMFDAKGIYDYLVENKIIVRDRSRVHLCENSLRITVGSKKENEILIDSLNDLI
ncbi:MAG: histidinol-phosphate transaminase [Prolixibacteraceae bacterium]|nr:histidinol-phosphate transaminase [Prolixibacteraceae bacterium]MBN2773062.1 histidinol-phosphate transaminase [Prolixibacteraceae bacterium]